MGEGRGAGSAESREPFWGALSVSWSPRAIFFPPSPRSGSYTMNELGRLLCFPLFSAFIFLETLETGRTGSRNNPWLMINCKLQLNSINPFNPWSLGPESMSEEGFLLGTFQNNHFPLFSAFLGRSCEGAKVISEKVHVRATITDKLQIISGLQGARCSGPLGSGLCFGEEPHI